MKANYLFSLDSVGISTKVIIAEMIISTIAFDEMMAVSSALIFPSKTVAKKINIPDNTNIVFVREPMIPDTIKPN